MLLFVSFGDHTAAGFSNLTEHGGFFPHGGTGLITAMLVVIYSYGGTEIIGVTLAETKNPEKVVPKAVRGTLTRIVAFYLFAVFHHCQPDPVESSEFSSRKSFCDGL